MSTIRLAMAGPPAICQQGLNDPADRPAFLVSYFYWKNFVTIRDNIFIRDYVLDSGAFSAKNSSAEIRLTDYIYFCKKLMDSASPPTEIFSLDVIGNAKASLRNAEVMWKAGIEAIPTYHKGSPFQDLKHIGANYPKIALGGVARIHGAKKIEFARECFARIYPMKIHGFGYGAEEAIKALPFHSVDATSWILGPQVFGRWSSFGYMPIRDCTAPVRREVNWYLKLERKVRYQWRNEMELLDRAGKLRSDEVRDAYFASREPG